MAIFIKLFATKIVARSFLGFSNSLEIISRDLDDLSESSKSNWVSENRATSAPEIKAEQNNNKTNNINPDIMEVSMTKKEINKLMGSGSKLVGFS